MHSTGFTGFIQVQPKRIPQPALQHFHLPSRPLNDKPKTLFQPSSPDQKGNF
jgi:hypothetical protein